MRSPSSAELLADGRSNMCRAQNSRRALLFATYCGYNSNAYERAAAASPSVRVSALHIASGVGLWHCPAVRFSYCMVSYRPRPKGARLFATRLTSSERFLELVLENIDRR